MKRFISSFGFGLLIGGVEGLWRLASFRYMGIGAALAYVGWLMCMTGIVFVVLSWIIPGLLRFWQRRHGGIGEDRYSIRLFPYLVGWAIFMYGNVGWHMVLRPTESILSVIGLLASLVILLVSGIVVWLLLQINGEWRPRWPFLTRGLRWGCMIAFVVLLVIGVESKKQHVLRSSGVGSPSAYNLVMIVVDTLRADHLGCYGYSGKTSSTIDRLAREGVRFERAVCQIPRTNPSHACMMTGLYPHEHGSRDNGQPIRRDVRTLAQMLRANGYETAAFVSIWSLVSRVSGLHHGFAVYQDLIAGSDWFPISMLLETMPLRPLQRFPFAQRTEFVQRSAERVNRDVHSWLSRKVQPPFFLWVHYVEPHLPYDPPPPFNAEYMKERRCPLDLTAKSVLSGLSDHTIPATPAIVADLNALYDGEICYVDSEIDKLLNELESRGLLDKTLVVLTGDHGESIFDYHQYLSHGRYLYDPELRIPLIMVQKNRLPAGSVVKPQIRTVDYLATLLALLGVADTTPAGTVDFSKTILSGGVNTGMVSFAESGLEHPLEPGRKIYSVCNEAWKVIAYPNARIIERYDLVRDPQEKTSLDAADSPVFGQLESELQNFIKQAMTVQYETGRRMSLEDQEKLRSLGYVR